MNTKTAIINSDLKEVKFELTDDLKESFDLIQNQPSKYCILLDGIGNVCVWDRGECKRIKPLWNFGTNVKPLPLVAIASYLKFPIHITEKVVTKNGLVRRGRKESGRCVM